MLALGSFLIFTGFAALFLATVGAPYVARVLRPFGRTAKKAPVECASIELLVPAHNEEKVIEATLRSLVAALEALNDTRSSEEQVVALIRVGLDHCTDQTAAIVSRLAVEIGSVQIVGIENPGPAGKWNVLRFLISQSDAAWVGLVDSGSVWDRNLLVAAWPSITSSQVMGVAPSYLPKKAGRLESLNWKLEQSLKSAENLVGGPVSVHGASVLYRSGQLAAAMKELGDYEWLNDDVVIPMTLRFVFPGLSIVYMAGGPDGAWVTDIGLVADVAAEYRRRRRMALGNLQWISNIFVQRASSNTQIAIVASRRVFRTLWAYWIVCLGLGSVLTTIGLFEQKSAVFALMIFALVIGFGFVSSNWVRRVFAALLSGLAVPALFKELKQRQSVKWV